MSIPPLLSFVGRDPNGQKWPTDFDEGEELSKNMCGGRSAHEKFVRPVVIGEYFHETTGREKMPEDLTAVEQLQAIIDEEGPENLPGNGWRLIGTNYELYSHTNADGGKNEKTPENDQDSKADKGVKEGGQGDKKGGNGGKNDGKGGKKNGKGNAGKQGGKAGKKGGKGKSGKNVKKSL